MVPRASGHGPGVLVRSIARPRGRVQSPKASRGNGMLSFFSGPVACPVEPAVKQWVEHRLTWLVGQFGRQRLLGGTVVLPTPEFFPDPFDGSPDSARPILARVCGYMGIDPAKVELDFYEYRRPPDAKRSDAAAGRFRVWLGGSDPFR